jgi:hypothetical protein
MGHLVDQHDPRTPGNDGIDVDFFGRPDELWRDNLEVLDMGKRSWSAARNDQTDNHVSAPLMSPPALVQHGDGLTDAGC